MTTFDGAIKRLRALYEYYFSSRGAGHTTAMLRGALVTDAMILVANYQSGESVQRIADTAKRLKFISYASDLQEQLRGTSAPLAIDNQAMMFILKDALGVVDQFEAESKSMSLQLHDAQDALDAQSAKIQALEREVSEYRLVLFIAAQIINSNHRESIWDQGRGEMG